jgi:hypothetical protein
MMCVLSFFFFGNYSSDASISRISHIIRHLRNSHQLTHIIEQVVLPVVARKKGLEGYYEKTNPHLQLKKRIANGLAQEIVAPVSLCPFSSRLVLSGIWLIYIPPYIGTWDVRIRSFQISAITSWRRRGRGRVHRA